MERTDRQTDGQTDRQTDRQTHTHRRAIMFQGARLGPDGRQTRAIIYRDSVFFRPVRRAALQFLSPELKLDDRADYMYMYDRPAVLALARDERKRSSIVQYVRLICSTVHCSLWSFEKKMQKSFKTLRLSNCTVSGGSAGEKASGRGENAWACRTTLGQNKFARADHHDILGYHHHDILGYHGDLHHDIRCRINTKNYWK